MTSVDLMHPSKVNRLQCLLDFQQICTGSTSRSAEQNEKECKALQHMGRRFCEICGSMQHADCVLTTSMMCDPGGLDIQEPARRGGPRRRARPAAAAAATPGCRRRQICLRLLRSGWGHPLRPGWVRGGARAWGRAGVGGPPPAAAVGGSARTFQGPWTAQAAGRDAQVQQWHASGCAGVTAARSPSLLGDATRSIRD